jgi:quinol monooxygenase YgiN
VIQINPDLAYIIVVNVFNVSEGQADKLIALAVEGTENVISKADGFVSSSFHKSLDGKNVVNYAQWKTIDNLQQSMRQPGIQTMMQEMSKIAIASPGIYTVSTIVENNKAI